MSFFKPGKFVTESTRKSLQRQITSEYREIILVDLLIIIFLAASAHQLACYFEGNLEPSFWSWVKAVGFDGAIALFSRNVSRAVVLRESARATWWSLIFLMIITVFANLGYEHLKYTGGIGEDYIDYDLIRNIRGALISGSLAIIILGISAVRALAAKSFENRKNSYKLLLETEKQKRQVKSDNKMQQKWPNNTLSEKETEKPIEKFITRSRRPISKRINR